MRKKSFIFMIASMFVTMLSYSQTIKENIEKLSKSPKTAENAAKADVYITGNKKIISDTTAQQVPVTKKTANISRKKKKSTK